MRKHIWALAFSVCLVAFTAYISLDTFAFANVYQEDATEMNTSMFDGALASSAAGAASASEDSPESDSASASGSSLDSALSSDDESSSDEETSSSSTEEASSSSHGKPSSSSSSSTEGRSSRKGPSGMMGGKPGGSSGGSSSSSSTASEDSEPADVSSATTTGQAQEYSDDNVSISLSEYDVDGTTVYVADVTVSSAEYLKTAFANDSYGKNVTAKTSETASAHDAILAINGDNYGSRERGYVIRNGIVYRDTADDSDALCIYADGSFKVVDPSTVSAQELVEQGVWQAFSFGPALVQDSSVSVSQDDEVGRAMASNPRTAIGVIDNNHYVFVVSDGRTDESEGLTLYELAQFMQQKLGVECAYNLDGGGSSTMVFNGSVVNNPTTQGSTIKERDVNDIVYIG